VTVASLAVLWPWQYWLHHTTGTVSFSALVQMLIKNSQSIASVFPKMILSGDFSGSPALFIR
jgi:hypothetical protein